MNSLAKLSLASALMLSAAFGVAQAQQANDAAASTRRCNALMAQGPGCDDDMGGGMGRGMANAVMATHGWRRR